ncbi:DUF1223 domain-containing protein [Halioglobus japonicus]|uniref:DUF1223 domain-containing protein n=1 Tax=Halioglobus japonicus TaxID=930805 RepID=UPI000A02A01C|nr:DUF1223 domain-containing protein [Halioglobus japonicus]
MARYFSLAIFLVFLTLPALAEQRFVSPERQATLLELYTSQGCSSCPPAERWFNTLTDSSRLWDDLVPVVFHVDDWSYLGWKDRFARAEFSQRQRRYKAEDAVQVVYPRG